MEALAGPITVVAVVFALYSAEVLASVRETVLVTVLIE
jgi:hypothetical protein